VEDLVEPIFVPRSEFWKGKKVLVTGHTGFKGSWLSIWLSRLGAEVIGISLAQVEKPNLFCEAQVEHLCSQSYFCDISDSLKFPELVRSINPDVVFHLAAQALVRPSYQDPVTTFRTNFMGSIHLLDAIRGLSDVRVIVMITTDKVYKTLQSPRPFCEDDALGGYDPYSASKASSEIAIASFRDAFLTEQGVALATARAGNVIAGGDWSIDRLLPDAVKAWKSGETLVIRRPDAIRPWQHVLEPLAGYLILAESLWSRPELACSYNFGPKEQNQVSVKSIIELASKYFDNAQIMYGDPHEGPFESEYLALDTSKAKNKLGYFPVWDCKESVERAMNWYVLWNSGVTAIDLCNSDFDHYENSRQINSQSLSTEL
tara:strand:+ start:174 stop:1292 length:1119 start_codon:yes stop_codon:yes gene_type:complete